MKIAGWRPDAAVRDHERLQAMTAALEPRSLANRTKISSHAALANVLGYFFEINHRRLTYVLEEYAQGDIRSRTSLLFRAGVPRRRSRHPVDGASQGGRR